MDSGPTFIYILREKNLDDITSIFDTMRDIAYYDTKNLFPILIAPRSLSDRFVAYSDHYTIIFEEDILSEKMIHAYSEDIRNQLLYLYVVNHVRTETYIPMDINIKINWDNLDNLQNGNGKSLMICEAIDVSSLAKYFGLNAPSEIMNAIPNILNAKIVNRLLRDADKRLSKKVPNNFNMFHLYSCFMHTHNLLIKYHIRGELLNPRSIDSWIQAYDYIPDVYESSLAPFYTINKNCGVPLDIIEDMIDNKRWKYSSDPLISCLMVTKNRLDHVKRAIRCYQNQTYRNKQLVVVEDGDDGTKEYILELEDNSIKLHHPTSCFTLGDLRNISIDIADGEYCMQWDDDDYYHPSRIAVMLKKLGDDDAIFLGQWTMAFPMKGWYTISHIQPSGWEGTMLARKSVIPRYPPLTRGEDTVFCSTLRKNTNKIKVITEPGYHILYQYNVHGNNTWSDETNSHFVKLFRKGTPLHKYDKYSLASKVRQSACDKTGSGHCKGIWLDRQPDPDNDDIATIVLWLVIIIVILIGLGFFVWNNL